MSMKIVDLKKIQTEQHPVASGLNSFHTETFVKLSDLEDCPEAPDCDECKDEVKRLIDKERIIMQAPSGEVLSSRNFSSDIVDIINSMPLRAEVKDG
ncbi:hypothetical protein LCGC14_0758070 [marine sediment metagenome]|uniref:Uncharacterized protein n=1 Tax=marine sediment metagenome TaxID=412755 RepID=A0A0F9Q218_9ZZZZ